MGESHTMAAASGNEVSSILEPITPLAAPRYQLETVSYQASQARAWQRAAAAWKIATACFGALSVLLAVALIELMPLKTVVPVFAYINEAGLLDTTTAISDLPKSTQVAGIEALLWQYVRRRESYAYSEAEESYIIVSAMSDQLVRGQYQQLANPKYNTKSPAATLKRTGFIRVNKASGAWVSHTADYSSGVYQIRFCKVTAEENGETTEQRMIVALTYSVAQAVPLWERTTFNPVGVIITDYPPPQQEGALGASHPCE